MPLFEAHVIIYILIGISCVSLGVAGVCLTLEAIDMHRYFKACKRLTDKELKWIKQGKF